MAAVVELFRPLKKLFKIDLKEANTDNNVFRLHYRASVLVLLVCATLLGWKEYIGDPMVCMSDNTVPDKVLNSYCWIFSTYTFPDQNMLRVGKDVAQPGVGPPGAGEEFKFHRYYQWVTLSLFLQSLLFRIPRTLWKMWERGRLSILIKDLDVPLVSKECKQERKELLIDHLAYNLGHQNNYFWRFVFCEMLNFANVVGQIFFMDMFLDGDFIRYGTEVLDCAGGDSDHCMNPMSRIFPKVSKCEFYKYGPSGDVEKRDALCVLSINIINEKLYIFLWFWFMFVTGVTSVMMIFRGCVVISSKLRIYLLYSRAQQASLQVVTLICQRGGIGDWFVLYQLSKNIDSRVFVEMLVELHEYLSNPNMRLQPIQNPNMPLQPMQNPNKHRQPMQNEVERERTANRDQIRPEEVLQVCYPQQLCYA